MVGVESKAHQKEVENQEAQSTSAKKKTKKKKSNTQEIKTPVQADRRIQVGEYSTQF